MTLIVEHSTSTKKLDRSNMHDGQEELLSILQFLKSNQLTDFIFEIDNIITNVQLSEDDKELKIREIITGVLQ